MQKMVKRIREYFSMFLLLFFSSLVATILVLTGLYLTGLSAYEDLKTAAEFVAPIFLLFGAYLLLMSALMRRKGD